MRLVVATASNSLGAALGLFLGRRGWDVHAVVSNVDDLRSTAGDAAIDVVLLDARLGRDLAGLVADVRSAVREARVVVLGAGSEGGAAASAGADGYAELGDPPEVLLATIARHREPIV